MQVLQFSRHEITRSRKVTACITCRLRKIKCDKETPDCRKCVSAGRICRYAKDGKFSESELEEERRESVAQAVSTTSSSGDSLSSGTQDGLDRHDTICGKRCMGPSTWGFDNIRSTHPQELHELLRWYLDYCDFFLPVADAEELEDLHTSWLCNGKAQNDRSLPLLLALYATAATAIEACRGPGALSITPKHWRNLATRLLVSHGYPAFECHIQTHAAVLLTLLDSREDSKGMHTLLVALLARTALADLPPYQPTDNEPASPDSGFRSQLFWHIQSLDTIYSLTHGLIPLLSQVSLEIHKPSFRAITSETATTVFQNFHARASFLRAQILNQIYHSSSICISTFESLELSTATLIAEAEAAAQALESAAQPGTTPSATDNLSPGQTPTEHARTTCIAPLLRLTAHKASLTLHAPYLQSTQWPTRSRDSALASASILVRAHLRLACPHFQTSSSASAPGLQAIELLPFRWLLKLYPVSKALEVLLWDLLAYPDPGIAEVECMVEEGAVAGNGSVWGQSERRREMLELVETCFEELYEPTEEWWGRSAELRGRVWGMGPLGREMGVDGGLGLGEDGDG